jgi:peptidoglycan/LPS O-acetylase OafA/YrhL
MELLPWGYWRPYVRAMGLVGGWQGVDLFFAVSGFVIASGLLPQLRPLARHAGVAAQWRSAWPLLRRFWVRRIWRLWPAAWLWLGIVPLATAWLIGQSAFRAMHTNFWAAVAGVFLFANFRYATAGAHFRYYGATVTYWRLSLEEQFYLVLPPAILLAGRCLPWLLIAGIAVQFPLARCIALLERHVLFRRWEPRWSRWREVVWCLVVWGLLLLLTQVGGKESMPHWPFEIGMLAPVAIWQLLLTAMFAGVATPVLTELTYKLVEMPLRRLAPAGSRMPGHVEAC